MLRKDITVIMMMIAICFAGITLRADDSSWEKLKNIRYVSGVKILADNDTRGSIVLHSYVMEMKQIREILEKSGISEEVSLELGSINKVLYRLGKYKPVVEKSENRSKIVFETLPDLKKVSVRIRNGFYNEYKKSSWHTQGKNYFPYKYLIVKDKDSKIRANIRLQTTFIPR